MVAPGTGRMAGIPPPRGNPHDRGHRPRPVFSAGLLRTPRTCPGLGRLPRGLPAALAHGRRWMPRPGPTERGWIAVQCEDRRNTMAPRSRPPVPGEVGVPLRRPRKRRRLHPHRPSVDPPPASDPWDAAPLLALRRLEPAHWRLCDRGSLPGDLPRRSEGRCARGRLGRTPARCTPRGPLAGGRRRRRFPAPPPPARTQRRPAPSGPERRLDPRGPPLAGGPKPRGWAREAAKPLRQGEGNAGLAWRSRGPEGYRGFSPGSPACLAFWRSGVNSLRPQRGARSNGRSDRCRVVMSAPVGGQPSFPMVSVGHASLASSARAISAGVSGCRRT